MLGAGFCGSGCPGPPWFISGVSPTRLCLHFWRPPGVGLRPSNSSCNLIPISSASCSPNTPVALSSASRKRATSPYCMCPPPKREPFFPSYASLFFFQSTLNTRTVWPTLVCVCVCVLTKSLSARQVSLSHRRVHALVPPLLILPEIGLSPALKQQSQSLPASAQAVPVLPCPAPVSDS